MTELTRSLAPIPDMDLSATLDSPPELNELVMVLGDQRYQGVDLGDLWFELEAIARRIRLIGHTYDDKILLEHARHLEILAQHIASRE